MEKTYGKGSVSWLDSAVAGGPGGAEQFDATKRGIDEQSGEAAGRAQQGQKDTADFNAGQARDLARRQANYDAQQKMAAQHAKDAERLRVDAYGRGPGYYGAQYDPNHAHRVDDELGDFSVWYGKNLLGHRNAGETVTARDEARSQMAADTAPGGRRAGKTWNVGPSGQGYWK